MEIILHYNNNNYVIMTHEPEPRKHIFYITFPTQQPKKKKKEIIDQNNKNIDFKQRLQTVCPPG